jgi:prevent-host-death family protein
MDVTYDADMEPKTMGTAEFRDQLGPRVDAAHFMHEPTVVTRNGEPRAVLIAYSEWLASRPDEVRPPSPPA